MIAEICLQWRLIERPFEINPFSQLDKLSEVLRVKILVESIVSLEILKEKEKPI